MSGVARCVVSAGLGALCSLAWLTGQDVASSTTRIQAVVEEIFELDDTAERFRTETAARELSLRNNAFRRPLAEVTWALRWTRIMFQEPDYRIDYTQGFIEGFDSRHAHATLEWLRSPLAKKLNALQSELSRPGGLEKLNAFLASPEAQRARKSREETLKRFSEARRCAERNLTLIVDSHLALEWAVNSQLPADKQLSVEELRARAAKIGERDRDGIELGCWLPLTYVFRDVADQELESYIAFFETDAGRWYTEAHQRGTREAWISGNRRVAETGYWTGQVR